jgi:hypothetical protein
MRYFLPWFIAGLILATLLNATAARAEFFSGNALATKLNSSSAVDQAVALGFIQGVFDVYVNVTICPPNNGAGVTAGQLNDMIKNYLNNNPALRHHTAESIINEALKSLWPCKQQPRRNGTPI